jgi:hypothetical protein
MEPQLTQLAQIEAVSSGTKPGTVRFRSVRSMVPTMPRTNQPVRFIGRQPFTRIPIAHLADINADFRLNLERDLRDAPTPISGGMRKALAKELVIQNSLRFRPPRRYREQDLRRAYGLLEANCRHCRHTMYFDEVEDGAAIRCDRCKRPLI